MKNRIFGLDLAKNVFHLMGQNNQRKKLRRPQVLKYFANLPRSCIAMEACGGAHYWARELVAIGHEVVLLPPQHVKGYLRGQKNDYNDAQAILEAAEHGKVRTVPIKSVEQQDRQALIRIRELLTAEQTRQVNQIRGLLYEYGIAIPKGIAAVRNQLADILSNEDVRLSPALKELLHRKYDRLRSTEDEKLWYDKKIKQYVKTDPVCQRLMEIPAFGPIVSYAFNGWLGGGKQFARGRDASASLGVVPRQHSSGDKNRLLGITKRGDSHLRSLIIHGARSVVSRAGAKTDRLSLWVQRLVETRGFNKAVVALANKLIRIAWVVVARGERYQPQNA